MRELLGDRVTDIDARQQTLRVTELRRRVPSSATSSRPPTGPTIVAYRGIADDPARVAELDRELEALGDRYLADGVMEWEYLLVTAVRA